MAAQEKALSIKNLSKLYNGKPAVDDISFDIEPGEFFGFLGPNGAGKSTTIHSITGIARFDSGEIKVFGHDVVDDYRTARTYIGLSSQEFNVDLFNTPYNILWYMGGFFGMSRAERKKRVDELLELFELEEHAKKPFRALSGGLKRRVMLGRAMMHNPDLLILDEPTAGVDVELRRELWKYLKRINKEGKTIFLTSHYLEEVEQLCNRIAIIHHGKIVKIGKKEELVKNGKKLEDVYLDIIKNNHDI